MFARMIVWAVSYLVGAAYLVHGLGLPLVDVFHPAAIQSGLQYQLQSQLQAALAQFPQL
ncbi:hypothetical protein Sulac_0383 [Sulfobacillus acidophilus DSM 10332]|uniref:Uncharacterized protein n=1 Tax=Sulfobacillus acidophilus (strain ATCC 700253 / DSM 10332 / NAL) TaxID=679936 RepID=G8TY44_SULAD|nr:hypothetical protein Sulac_0383 [Sulfobacillus acidophilus DSM 10332]